jgi:transcriptional regulator with XRE-family HTH domain
MLEQQKRPGVQEDVRRSMKLAGEWMRAVRERAGLSQRQVSFPTKKGNIAISEMEAGKTRLTAPYYDHWARAVGLETRLVAQVMIGFHTPFLYEPLFGEPFQPDKLIVASASVDNLAHSAVLKNLRNTAGLSHSEMAGLMGVSTRVYVAYEDGSRRIPEDQLAKITQNFDLAAQTLPARKTNVDTARRRRSSGVRTGGQHVTSSGEEMPADYISSAKTPTARASRRPRAVPRIQTPAV